MAITKTEMKQMLKQLEDKLINSFTEKIAKFKQEIQEELKETKQALSTTYDLALKNENEINGLKDEVKALKELVTAQQTVTNKKAKSIEELKKSSSEQHEVLEDQVNRSLRKTLVFKGLAGTSDEKWDDTRQKLNSFIEAKIPTLQNVHPVERAHYAVNKANKDPNDKTSNVIFACFYNWNDAQLILKEFREKPTEVRAEQMYSPSLTKRRNAAMLKRKELKESGKIVAGYVAFPANLKVKTEKDEGCVFGGETFKYNERFVDPECKGYCTCTGPGSFGCVSLCPPIGLPACRLDEKVVMEEMRVKSSNCSCTYPRCVKDEDYVTPPFPVTFPGKKASPEFHDDPTTTLPATEAPSTTETTTEADFGFEYKEGPLPTPYPTTTEAPITTEAFPPFHHCFILGKVYQDRETFVSEDCKGYCKCDKGSISCVSLCPPVGVECTADEKEVTVTEPVADVCTCQRPKCVARYDVIGNVVIEEDDSNDENEV